MGFSEEFRREVEEKLSKVVAIRTKAMFGGVGIYSGELFFALIADDKLYFKVGDTNRSDYEQAAMEPLYPYQSATPMQYWELPPGVLGKPKDLAIWVDKSLAVAQLKKAKRK